MYHKNIHVTCQTNSYFHYIPDVGDSPYMIFEYMIHGDLAELLRRNDPVMRKNENDFKLQKVSQKFRYPYLISKSKVCCKFKNQKNARRLEKDFFIQILFKTCFFAEKHRLSKTAICFPLIKHNKTSTEFKKRCHFCRHTV